MDLQQSAVEKIKARFGDQVLGTGQHAGQVWISVKREKIVEILRLLRDELACDFLMDLTAVDYMNQGEPERFAVVYNLYSTTENQRFRVKAWVPENDPTIDTAGGLWRSAPWAEREVYDFFGITFRGHPDLKRIMLPETYTGHPLRKDYPLTGYGERHDFPKYVK